MDPLVFTLSNRLELLYDSLSPYLYKNRTDPLGKILIIVPSAAMKSWFMGQASAKQKIAFGFEVVLLNDAIRKLSTQNSHFLLNKTDLAIRIESELQQMNDHPFIALFKQPPSAKRAKIATEIADVFLIYGEYQEAELEKLPDWQKELWNKIYPATSSNKPLFAYLKNLDANETLPLQVHLFGFSYLSDVKQYFFENLNTHIPVHYWVLSPSRMLWSDQKSRKEQYFMASILQKQGVKFSQIQEMQEYLEESNPLIGNNGRLGRKWREKMEDSLSITSEVYGIADSLPDYEDDLIDGVIGYPSSQLTLLEAVQADLTLLTIREEPLILASDDRSIEIHGAPSRFREIEALYETLVKACSSQNIHSGEIIVMAPELESYIPFIKTVFNRRESQLPFEILERNSLGESSYIRLFFAFLELSDSRWELESLFEVLESPHFHDRNSLIFDDLMQVKAALTSSGIRWGIDLAHRESVCRNPVIETTQKGSWKGGIESLLSSLIYTKEAGAKGILSFTQSELFSLFLDLFQNLRQDLSFMLDVTERPVEEWKELLNTLIEKYLGSYADEEAREDLSRIIRKLPGKMSLNVKSLIVHLKALAEETPTVFRSRNLQSVRFCPLLPMRAIPAELIVVLGMNSESFPRIERKSPLALSESATYIPSPTDYDRYLFLESLLSARKKWILSYVNSEEKSPSCLIQEVTHYLDANFRIGEKYPSEVLTFAHPEIPFDSGYFIADAPCPSPSLVGYKSALSYRKTIQNTSTELLPPIPVESLNIELLPKHLTLRQLKNFVYNPIQHHLNHAHGIYLQKEDHAHPDMMEFSEEKLWDSEWLKWALQYPIDKVVSLADLKGRFPCEPFKQPAKDRLKNELEDRLGNLAKNEIALSDIFEVEFSYDCKAFQQVSEQSWKAPAVIVPYRGQMISITGVLPYVSHKGYLSLREPKTETLIQMLPEILLLQTLPIEKQLIFIKKNQKMTPKPISWELFLDHFLRSLHQPLPHSPSWIASILSDNPKGLHQSIKLSVSDPFRKKEDPYLKWVFPQVETIDCAKLISDWKNETILQFGALLETP